MKKLIFLSAFLIFACSSDDSTVETVNLEIGDVYENGIVFQVNGNGTSGMLAKTGDTGLMNWYEAMDSESNDWTVPTIYQLGTMYDAIGQAADNIGNFEMSKYWSSTEHSGGTGYAFNFATGESNIGYNGILNCRVRLVRSF
jgi:hypothetical protein